MKKLLWMFGIVIITGAVLTACADDPLPVEEPLVQKFEVWITDQAAEVVLVYDGDTYEEIARIDVDDGDRALGKVFHVEKPHMVAFGPSQKYGYLANVGSGETWVLNGETKTVVKRLPTGAGSHASIPSWDGTQVIVALVGGTGLQEIVVDEANESFEMGRLLDLSTELDPADFPNAKAICPMFTLDNSAVYVTIGGGGMIIVDPQTFTITRRFTKDEIAGNGCGLVNGPFGSNLMFANSGKIGTTDPNDGTGNFYVFDTRTHDLMMSMDLAPLGIRDAHGQNVTPDGQSLWVAGRKTDNMRRFDISSFQFTDDVYQLGDAPDILFYSPDGQRAFVSLRGQGTGTHAASGLEPGFAVIDMQTGQRLAHIPSGPDPTATDPHGLIIRRVLD